MNIRTEQESSARTRTVCYCNSIGHHWASLGSSSIAMVDAMVDAILGLENAAPMPAALSTALGGSVLLWSNITPCPRGRSR